MKKRKTTTAIMKQSLKILSTAEVIPAEPKLIIESDQDKMT